MQYLEIFLGLSAHKNAKFGNNLGSSAEESAKFQNKLRSSAHKNAIFHIICGIVCRIICNIWKYFGIVQMKKPGKFWKYILQVMENTTHYTGFSDFAVLSNLYFVQERSQMSDDTLKHLAMRR